MQGGLMKRKPLILVSLLVAAFVINLDTTIVNVALPSLVRQLHASNSQLQWVVDAFNLLFAGSVLAAGSLSDRFGRKGMLLAGLSVFGLATVAGERRVEQPMLDLSLFRNPRFTAASVSVAISFFALSGFIFLVTQYFQFLKGYGPLSTGVRLLPVAACVAISSILGARLAVRVGTKLVVASGLFSMAAFYVWVTTAATTTGYVTIAAQMVVLGAGMGLTSAPATEAIMGVVPKAKAGVGSAVNDATRLLGGTLGVAVIGSVYASLYASRLTSD